MDIHTLTCEDIRALLGVRRRDCSKRDNGQGVLVAGSKGFSGAAVMASFAALRAGAGTLKTITPRGVADALYALPEAMCIAYPKEDWDADASAFILTYMQSATAVGIGPGLGRGEGREDMVTCALSSGKPCVIDADGLFALSLIGDKRAALHDNAVLTPHFGEMARLTGMSAADIGYEQAGIALLYARQWGCTVLLKGPESVIASPDGRLMKNITGNPGLAKGGSGDVLAGIVLALLCQGMKPFDAACAGAYILGASADKALGLLGERMLMARDVTDSIERTLNGFDRNNII